MSAAQHIEPAPTATPTTLSESRSVKSTDASAAPSPAQYVTRAVLAAAYRGKSVGRRALLTHAVNATGEPLCRSVAAESICDEALPGPPSCAKCVAKLARVGKLCSRMHRWYRTAAGYTCAKCGYEGQACATCEVFMGISFSAAAIFKNCEACRLRGQP